MIAFRKAHPSIGRPVFWREDIKWRGPDGPADLSAASRCLAFVLHGAAVNDDDLCVMLNAHWEDREFALPEGRPDDWCRVVDTARPAPEDILEPGREAAVESAVVKVRARSVIALRKPRSRRIEAASTPTQPAK
jgi:glycogen operon protein